MDSFLLLRRLVAAIVFKGQTVSDYWWSRRTIFLTGSTSFLGFSYPNLLLVFLNLLFLGTCIIFFSQALDFCCFFLFIFICIVIFLYLILGQPVTTEICFFALSKKEKGTG